MMSPRYAFQLSRILYERNGDLKDYDSYSDSEIYLSLLRRHNNKSKHTIEYWKLHNLQVVPEKYIIQHIADRLADCNLSWEKYLVVSRDLFFYENKSIYENQIQKIYKKLLREKRN